MDEHVLVHIIYNTNINAVGACTFHVGKNAATMHCPGVCSYENSLLSCKPCNFHQATIYGVLIAFFKVVLYRQLIDDLHVHTGIT